MRSKHFRPPPVSLKKTEDMNTLQKMTYGHYIVTALKKGEELKSRDEDWLAAGTVNWASQVSFEPEMIMVAIDTKSQLNQTINYSGSFTLHLLSKDHKDMIGKFGEGIEVKDGKINGIEFTKEDDSELVLDNTLGHIRCEVDKSENVGDHTIYFGKVVHKHMTGEGEALCTMQTESQYSKENMVH